MALQFCCWWNQLVLLKNFRKNISDHLLNILKLQNGTSRKVAVICPCKEGQMLHLSSSLSKQPQLGHTSDHIVPRKVFDILEVSDGKFSNWLFSFGGTLIEKISTWKPAGNLNGQNRIFQNRCQFHSLTHPRLFLERKLHTHLSIKSLSLSINNQSLNQI